MFEILRAKWSSRQPVKLKNQADIGYQGSSHQRYGHLSYAQHGEDLLLVSIFDSIGIEKPTYLDIGALDPFVCSNTALLHSRGSHGVNIDANPDVIELFRQHRPNDVSVNCGVGGNPGIFPFFRIQRLGHVNSFSKEWIEWALAHSPDPTDKVEDVLPIEVKTLDQVVNDHCNGVCPDLLSIDAEGFDYAILETFSFTTRPSVICVETTPDEDRFTDLLSQRGFGKLIQVVSNGIYIDQRWWKRVVRGKN